MSPHSVRQTIDEAIALHQRGRLTDAEAICRQIIAANPTHAGALNLLGVIAHQSGKPEMAADLIGRAATINPGDAGFHTNLGLVCMALGRFGQAASSFKSAFQLRPGSADLLVCLGVALCEMRDFPAAIDAMKAALAIKPDLPEAWNNLGIALRKLGQLDEAADALAESLRLRPDSADPIANLADVFKERGQLDEAIALYRRGSELAPNDPGHGSYGLYTSLFHPKFDSATIDQNHRAWGRRFADPLSRSIQPNASDRNPDRRLRIGCVTADLRYHVMGWNMFPLFRNHDRSQFEIICFFNHGWPDEISRQFRELSDGWHDVHRLSDAQLADLVRTEKIDILVDFTMHMSGTRLLTFARKPAPVQVTFVAYPGTTGVSAIDYRITDRYLDPPGARDSNYCEQSIRLPHSFWCYEPPGNSPDPAPPPVDQNGHVTFGCLSNFCKVSSETIAMWSAVLGAVPDSRLALFAPHGRAREIFLQRLKTDPGRIEFVDRAPREQYLEFFRRFDICLDTYPYNGHTTGLDAMWMGVPMVTRCGEVVVSRAGFSQASNLGQTDLVAHSFDEFVKLAVQLAGQRERVRELHQTLRPAMQKSPLTDRRLFARGIESVYREIWRRWCSAAS